MAVVNTNGMKETYHGSSALCPCLPTTGLKAVSMGPQPGYRAKEKTRSIGQVRNEV